MKIKAKYFISGFLAICLVFLYLLVQPYLFMYMALMQRPNQAGIYKCTVFAAKTSVFKFQKRHTYDLVVSDAYLVKDYKTALKYIERSRKLGINDKVNAIVEAEICIELKDYDRALKVAKEQNLKSLILKTYIAMNDKNNARIALEDYRKSEKNYKYLYDYYSAQVEFIDGNYDKANTEIDKYLSKNNKYINAWKLKSEISQKLGNKKDYEYSSKKVAELEKDSEEYIKTFFK